MSSRRSFIKELTLKTGGLITASSLYSLVSGQPATVERNKKLGIALVGLGGYSQGQLGPALKQTQFCKLAGIVTGTPSKIKKWQDEYDIPDKNVYNYDNFESIKNNKDIDIVYVVLPNAMHAEYVIKAAKAGKHVICEKPMGVSVKECQEMIKACKDANRMLSIGYRLHFEPYNIEMMRLGKEKVFGNIQDIRSELGFTVSNGGWRFDKELAGGGPLMDVGIYCVQGAIYTMGQNPIAVTAQEGEKTEKERFKEVEQSISWNMEFPGGVMANCKTSYNDNYNTLRAEAEKGWFELAPAFTYGKVRGQTSLGKMNFPDVYEQVYQIDDFAKCIIHKKPTKVPGEMGLRDVKIMTAIYEAARTGERVELKL